MTTRVNLSGIDGNTGTLAESLTINAISHSTDISITSNSHVGLFIESANGNVGIGTSSPSTALEVDGIIASINSGAGTDQLQLQGYGSTGYINMNGSGSLIFRMGSGYSEKMRITGGGNVGIGTGSPSVKLELGGETAQYPASLKIQRSGHASSTRAAMALDNFYVMTDTPGNGTLDFSIYDNNNAGHRLTIAANGNVGIGTTSPSVTLDVNGEILALSGAGTADRHIEIGVGRTGNGNSYLDLISDTTYTDYGARLIRYNTGVNTPTRLEHRGTGELSIWASDAGALQFGTSNTERMRITSGGNVGIGITSPTVDGSLAGLSVNASGTVLHIDDGDGATLKLTDPASGANRGLGISLQNTEAVISNCESGPLRFGTGNAERMRIDASGNVGIGTTGPINKLHIRNTTHSSTITGNATAGSIKFHSQSGSYTNGDYYGGIVWARPNSNGGTPTTFIASQITNSGAAADLVFGADTATVVTERMRIDNAGRVTMPFQPSFEVSVPQTWTTTATNTYAVTQWGTTHHNTGNHFSTSNGRFTAPVDGVYQFHGIMMGVNSSSPHLAFGINNSSQGGGLSYGNNDMWVHPNNSDNLIQIYHIIKLSAGDYVRLYTYSYNSVSASTRCYFGGHFLG